MWEVGNMFINMYENLLISNMVSIVKNTLKKNHWYSEPLDTWNVSADQTFYTNFGTIWVLHAVDSIIRLPDLQ